MKKLIYLIALLPIMVVGQTQSENYILSTTFRDSLNGKPQTNITYFDGIGRPKQNIAYRQAGTGMDLITPIAYDTFGRQTKDYLPYASESTATLDIYSNAIDEQSQFPYYANQVSYSEKLYELSPLGRVLKQAAPGNDWAMHSNTTDPDHTVKTEYQTNVLEEVKLFSANASWNPSTEIYEISLSETGNSFYPINTLYKTVTKDENWQPSDGNNHTTEEFKDLEGKVILKRTYGVSIVEETPVNVPHDTYYVYDQFGNLTYVLPPLYKTYETDLYGKCYQYKYDNRNRLVEKKLPGKQWEYIVYDKLDRIVATGPIYNPFGSNEKGWLITKYDIFSRIAYTGWEVSTEINSLSRKSKQDDYEGTSIQLFESRLNNAYVDDIRIDYTNSILPSDIILLSVNYYDNYNFPNAFDYPTSPILEQKATQKPKGLVTGSWVRILGNPNVIQSELTTTFYENKKFNPIQVYTQNYLGGYTLSKTKYAFDGSVMKIVTDHKRLISSNSTTTVEDFEYTEQGRLENHFHTINTLPKELISHNEYNELGQLTRKSVGGQDTTTFSGLQKVDYQYNIRGWMTDINNVYNLISPIDPVEDLFAFKINYNQIDIYEDEQTQPLFNGNIAQTLWKSNGDDILRKYGYQYDALNRLTYATYMRSNQVNESYNENLTYDKNGNIMSLFRNGNTEVISDLPITIDDLKYVYFENTNMLQAVNDNTNDPMGFKDYGAEYDYAYDENGNMISDKNKEISNITYNHLNLPTRIDFGTMGTISYIYDAAGRKVKKIVSENNSNTVTDYINGYQYVNDRLAFFPHSEGYVNATYCETCIIPQNTQPVPLFSYVYQYKDHLGNIRLSFGFDPRNQVVKIIEENHYYPFGFKHMNYNASQGKYDKEADDPQLRIVQVPSNSSLPYKYKYTGKEYQDELGLNFYDYGARNYDPAIGRWMSVDPLAEKWSSYSSYNFAVNNPVLFVDPNGEDVFLFYSLGNNHHDGDKQKDADKMFWQAALTRGFDMMKNGEIGDGDIAIFRQIENMSDIKDTVEKDVADNKEQYGKTAEFGLWSHGGDKGPFRNNSNGSEDQLSVKEWGKINFNWGDNAKAGFYGCRTGRTGKVQEAELGTSFCQQLSNQNNMKNYNVDVWGQTNRSWPSLYSNVRQTDGCMRLGMFSNRSVYMVGSDRSTGNRVRSSLNIASPIYPMAIFNSGVLVGYEQQPGTKK